MGYYITPFKDERARTQYRAYGRNFGGHRGRMRMGVHFRMPGTSPTFGHALTLIWSAVCLTNIAHGYHERCGALNNVSPRSRRLRCVVYLDTSRPHRADSSLQMG